MNTVVEQPQGTLVARGPATTRTIAFDTWCLGAHARNQGVYVYAGKLLQHFHEMAHAHGVEIAPYVSQEANNDANKWPAAPGFGPRPTRLLRFSRLWRFGGACMVAARQRPDLVFSPHCTSLYVGKLAPHVVTVHDLTPLFVPVGPRRISETLRFCLWWSARFSRAIITDSFHSRQDLVHSYKLPENKVSVVYLAHDQAVFNTSPYDPHLHRSLTRELGIQRPYILHHGVIKPNKNLKRLVQSFNLLLKKNRNLDLDLVVAGPFGWQHQEVLKAANENAGSVIFTGPLKDEDLAMLIKGATLAVFPSLYEGFCLPMLETMACGVPTIAARSSCLPEISGGVLRYFDPESLEEMAACMEKALENHDLRTELSEKGLLRVQDFDWRRCAEQTLKVLKRQLD